MKTGLDDFLATGKTKDDLMALASPELRKAHSDAEDDGSIYKASSNGIFWRKSTQDGDVYVPLTNFNAKITADILEDDGVEKRRAFEIETELNGRQNTLTVPSSSFPAMNWPVEHLGAAAIVHAGFSVKDKTREAIQMLSGEPTTRHQYTHTGWRDIEGQSAYLHAGGAIGAIEGAEVKLTGQLERFCLPEPPTGDRCAHALRASLGLINLAPDPISISILGCIYRSILGGVDYALHLSGTTGVFKSEIAAIAQQHFGQTMDSRNLPGSWSSTDNALEAQLFQAKDALVVLDDFAPTGTGMDVQRLHSKADRVIRGQGNNSGRTRMGPDIKLKFPKYSRGTILSTGEDIPNGHSLRARMLVLELSKGDIDSDSLKACQQLARDGVYAEALSAFIQFIAPRYAGIKAGLKTEVIEFRDKFFLGGTHRRTPEIAANLAVGLNWLLECAVDCGAISTSQRDKTWTRSIRGLRKAAEMQAGHHAASDPPTRLLELLSAALVAGKAHVTSLEGLAPENQAAWGWRQVREIGELSFSEWRPQGEQIGWLDGDDVYLQPDTAYSVAKKFGNDSGDGIVIGMRTMQKRLREAGMLLSVEESRGTLTVRKMIGVKREVVLHLHSSRFGTTAAVDEETDHDDQYDQTADD